MKTMMKKITAILLCLCSVLTFGACSDESAAPIDSPASEEPRHTCFETWTDVIDATATCTEDGHKTQTCSCGATREEVLYSYGHDWYDATCSAPKTCATCGKTEGQIEFHTFGNEGCTKCGFDNRQTITKSGVNFVVPGTLVLDYEESQIEITVTGIKFEQKYDSYSSFYVYYDAACIQKSNFSNKIEYALYDDAGYVITDGNEYPPHMSQGDKTKNQMFEIYLDHVNGADLKKGHTYTLKFLNAYYG